MAVVKPNAGRLVSIVLLLAPLSVGAGTAAPRLTVNASHVRTGDAVTVSWKSVLEASELAAIPELRTEWVMPEGSDSSSVHVERECQIFQEGDEGSYWVGQFSPAVTSIDGVTMTGDPAKGGGSAVTEGTPPFTTPAPVKFISGTQLSAGEFTFIVTNMRASVNWVLFQGSLNNSSNFKVVALSSPVEFVDRDKPSHARLARTSSTDEMRVSWTVTSGTCSDCVVQWGLAQEQLNRTSDRPDVSTYGSDALCGVPANSSGYHSPGDHHTVVLNLSEDPLTTRLAGLRYFYRIGSDTQGWTDVRSFLAPKPVHPHAPMNILVTADMGETYEDGSQYHWEEPSAVNTTRQMARIGAGAVDVLLHPGDLAYATGYESEWDRFMSQIEPLSSTTPYMTGQGNHERDFPHSGNSIGGGDSGGECGVPTQARFPMPVCPQPNTSPCIGTTKETSVPFLLNSNGSGPVGSQNDGWYSFEQGSVHFLMLNTEMSSKNGSRQWTFVQRDLAQVNRLRTPWVLVFGHRQMYSNNVTTPQNNLGDLEPLLLEHKVDIAFWGHIHFAQASCPMYKAKCITSKDAAGYDAPIHTVIGNAGQGLTPINYKAAPWSLYNAAKWGWSHVEVSNATHMRMSFYNDVPIGSAPTVDWSFDVHRKYPRA